MGSFLYFWPSAARARPFELLRSQLEGAETIGDQYQLEAKAPVESDRDLEVAGAGLVEAGVDLDRMPFEPGWDGSALDLAWAVDSLRPQGHG